MRGLVGAVLIAVLVGVPPARSGDSDPAVFLADTELALGAVPELRFAHWPVDRWAAIYARVADGSVVALSLKRRGGADGTGPVLRILHGAQRRVWIGGASGYVVSPRTGASSDREALIVLIAAGRPPDFGGLAPVIGTGSPDGTSSAGTFFRRLAAAQWLGDVDIHMVPYRIGSGEGGAVSSAGDVGVDHQLVFSGLPFEKVLMFADILAVETADVLGPMHIGRPDTNGRVAFVYRTGLDTEVLAGRLAEIAADLGMQASVSVDVSTRRLELSLSRARGN